MSQSCHIDPTIQHLVLWQCIISELWHCGNSISYTQSHRVIDFDWYSYTLVVCFVPVLSHMGVISVIVNRLNADLLQYVGYQLWSMGGSHVCVCVYIYICVCVCVILIISMLIKQTCIVFLKLRGSRIGKQKIDRDDTGLYIVLLFCVDKNCNLVAPTLCLFCYTCDYFHADLTCSYHRQQCSVYWSPVWM